jgi:hypothetical protein
MLVLRVVPIGVDGVKVSLRYVPRTPVAGIHGCGIESPGATTSQLAVGCLHDAYDNRS